MSDVNQIAISADGQDITITIGDYSDSDARTAISVSDAGGDGSLAYNNSTGVFTYTGPSASEVRAHISAGAGISIASGVITNTSLNTNTTYSVSAEDGTAGKKIIRLTGSDAVTDDVTLVQGSNVTLTRAGDEITIASTDTNTTYTQGVTATSGGANLNLVGTDSTTDTVKFAGGTGITVAETDASTITVTSTITQYTDALARAAVSATNTGTGYGTLSYDSATGVFTYAKVTGANIRTEVVDGRNLTYTTSTLDLDKALTSVNSVTAESATNLTLQGSDIVLQTVDNTGTSPSVTVASLGYRGDLNYNLSTFTDPVTVGGTSTTALPKYTIFFTAVSGTNTLTNVEIYHSENDPDLLTPLDWTALPVSAVGLAFTEDYVAGPSFGGALHGTIFPRGTKITSISPNAPATTATVTMTNNATASVTLYDQMANFSHMAYNSTNDLWAIIYGYNTGTGLFTNTVDTVEGTNGTTNYVDYSQLLATQFTATFTVNPVIRWRPRKITDLQPANATNDHLRVPFALGVGPGAVQTNRGLARDAFDAVGININNNGKLSGFTGKTGLNLTQFKSNSFFSSGTTAERCGPNFTFNSFAGDEDTATNALYLTDQDGLGQITWFAQPATSSLVSSTTTPASITVKATETHNGSTKQGAGMYLQYSPNSQTAAGRPKTFLRAENVTTELLAKTTLKLSKITTGTASSTAVLSQAAQLTWLTLDDTAATFTVPVKFPVYTRSAASAITGSVGMQIAISDSSGSSTQSDDGMMAFWATNGTPGWRYVHDNRAI